MPFALPALADLMAALFVLLLIIGTAVLATFLKHLLPKLPLIGTYLTDHVLDNINAAEAALVKAFTANINFLRNFITDVVYVDNWIVKEVVGAFQNHSSVIHTTINNTIPAAQGAAMSHADGLANSLQNNIDTARIDENADVNNLQHNITALSNFVNNQLTPELQGDIQSAASSAESGAVAQSHNELAQVESVLAGQLSQLSGVVNALGFQVSETIPAELAAQAQQETSDIAATKQTDLNNLLALQQQLQGEIDANFQTGTQALLNAEAGINTEINVQAFNQSQALAVAQASAMATISTSVNSLQGEINIDQTNIGALQQVTAVSIPLTIAAVASATAAITTEFDNCAVTTCEGPNSLSNALQGLLSEASTVADWSFFASAIKDPIGVGGDLAAVFPGLFETGQGLLDDLLSL